MKIIPEVRRLHLICYLCFYWADWIATHTTNDVRDTTIVINIGICDAWSNRVGKYKSHTSMENNKTLFKRSKKSMAKHKPRILNTENKLKRRIQNIPSLLGVLDTALCNKVYQWRYVSGFGWELLFPPSIKLTTIASMVNCIIWLREELIQHK